MTSSQRLVKNDIIYDFIALVFLNMWRGSFNGYLRMQITNLRRRCDAEGNLVESMCWFYCLLKKKHRWRSRVRIIRTTVTLIIITHTTLHNRENEARQDAPVMLSASSFHFAHERPPTPPTQNSQEIMSRLLILEVFKLIILSFVSF